MADLSQYLEKASVLAFLVSSMLAMGMSLTMSAITGPLKDRRLVLVTLGLNFVVAPALAFLLTGVIPIERGYAIGLLLLGAAAGAPFLPTIVEAAQGDLSLASALLGLLTLGTILLLPFMLPVLIPGLQANPVSIALPLILLIVLPLTVGMLVRSRASALAARVGPVLGKVGNISLILFFILLIVHNFRALLGVIGSGAILAALLFFAGLFVLGWVLGGSQREVRGVVGLATAGRNFGAALVPAANFQDPNVSVMIVVGAIVCPIVSLLAARWLRRASSPTYAQ